MTAFITGTRRSTLCSASSQTLPATVSSWEEATTSASFRSGFFTAAAIRG